MTTDDPTVIPPLSNGGIKYPVSGCHSSWSCSSSETESGRWSLSQAPESSSSWVPGWPTAMESAQERHRTLSSAASPKMPTVARRGPEGSPEAAGSRMGCCDQGWVRVNHAAVPPRLQSPTSKRQQVAALIGAMVGVAAGVAASVAAGAGRSSAMARISQAMSLPLCARCEIQSVRCDMGTRPPLSRSNAT